MKTSFFKTIVALSLLVSACGKQNLFRKAEDPDPLEEASTLLEQNKPDEAIVILKNELDDNPENYPALSLLATATAQKYGIDTITMALKLASTSTTQLSDNQVVALYAILPEATAANVAGIAEADGYLAAVPVANRTKSDFFRLSLLDLSTMVIRTKFYDKNADGKLDTNELLAMGTTDAAAILQTLAGAIINAAQGQGVDTENAAKVNEAMKGIQDKINAAPGTTQEEKLKNYLATQRQA